MLLCLVKPVVDNSILSDAVSIRGLIWLAFLQINTKLHVRDISVHDTRHVRGHVKVPDNHEGNVVKELLVNIEF